MRWFVLLPIGTKSESVSLIIVTPDSTIVVVLQRELWCAAIPWLIWLHIPKKRLELESYTTCVIERKVSLKQHSFLAFQMDHKTVKIGSSFLLSRCRSRFSPKICNGGGWILPVQTLWYNALNLFGSLTLKERWVNLSICSSQTGHSAEFMMR